MNTQEIITTVIEVVIVVGFFLFGKYVLPQIKNSTAYTTLSVLKQFVDTYVQGVEQTTKGEGTGLIKLETVTQLVSLKAEELGVKISEDDIRMLIESSVRAMNEGEKSTTTIKVEQ